MPRTAYDFKITRDIDGIILYRRSLSSAGGYRRVSRHDTVAQAEDAVPMGLRANVESTDPELRGRVAWASRYAAVGGLD